MRLYVIVRHEHGLSVIAETVRRPVWDFVPFQQYADPDAIAKGAGKEEGGEIVTREALEATTGGDGMPSRRGSAATTRLDRGLHRGIRGERARTDRRADRS
jgi:hypothetical protein